MSAHGKPTWIPDRLPRLDVTRALAAVELPLHLVNGGPMWTRLRRVKTDPPCPVIDVLQLLVLAAGTRPRSLSLSR